MHGLRAYTWPQRAARARLITPPGACAKRRSMCATEGTRSGELYVWGYIYTCACGLLYEKNYAAWMCGDRLPAIGYTGCRGSGATRVSYNV